MATAPTLMASRTFPLGAFDLDSSGHVTKDGELVGTWKTNSENRIVIKKGEGTPEVVNVSWKFNANNQLVLSAEGREIFNFHTDKTITPAFEVRNAVLRVTPSKLEPFTFELRGEWDLSAKHDLQFTPAGGSAPSTIAGFINSPEGKFIFFFADKLRPLLKHKLGFVGSWSTNKETAPAAETRLAFEYRREDGTTDRFDLPGAITINRTTNQLRYEYQKDGVQAIDFEGTLIVNPDFTISYHIARRLSREGEIMVGETTLGFGAVFQKNKFSGELELTLKKNDGTAGKTTLSIAGKFVGVLGSTSLAVGFQFNQVREGQTVTTTFAFAGSLQFSAGTVRFAFATSNAVTRTISLAIDADIKLGKSKLDARLNLDMGGGTVKGVTFLLGVKF